MPRPPIRLPIRRSAALPWHIFHGWKGLLRFWVGTLSLFTLMAALLQLAGPPLRTASAVPTSPLTAARPALAPSPASEAPPALPRVAIMLAGIGMSFTSSTSAIESLPPEISLALSPYAPNLSQLIPAIKAHGHEYLLSLPMEPEGQPVNDVDATRALMVALPDEENARRLREFLSQISGYAGVTSITGGMRGDRFLADPEMFNTVLHTVVQKDLFLIDSGGHKPAPHNLSANIILDDAPLDGPALDERLDQLVRIAQEQGSALGVIGLPRPVVLDRLAAWGRTLSAKGVALVPVSALIAASPVQEPAH